MDERFFLKLLFFLFAAFIVAELLVVAFFGFRLELILFSFVIAAALTGMVIVSRLLFRERSEIESVSMRRERQKSAGIMEERLRDYSVDHEFISGRSSRSEKGKTETSLHSSPAASTPFKASSPEISLDEIIRKFAAMYGGFGTLLRAVDQLDDTAFRRQIAKAGLSSLDGFSREEVILRINQMAEECSLQNSGSTGEKECVIDGFSLDSESFELYIQRSMSSSESDLESADSGFCVELDSEALSKRAGTMPSDFSHDPQAVFSKLKKTDIQA
jgi:hypothetical protein